MIGAVAVMAMPMPIVAIWGQGLLQPPQQVHVTAGAELDQDQRGGGMGHERLDQAVSLTGAKSAHLIGEVDHWLALGVHSQLLRDHPVGCWVGSLI